MIWQYMELLLVTSLENQSIESRQIIKYYAGKTPLISTKILVIYLGSEIRIIPS